MRGKCVTWMLTTFISLLTTVVITLLTAIWIYFNSTKPDK